MNEKTPNNRTVLILRINRTSLRSFKENLVSRNRVKREEHEVLWRIFVLHYSSYSSRTRKNCCGFAPTLMILVLISGVAWRLLYGVC